MKKKRFVWELMADVAFWRIKNVCRIEKALEGKVLYVYLKLREFI